MMPDEGGKPQESHSIVLSSSPAFDEKNVERFVVKKETRIDGGFVAWLQVVGAFCLFFTSWGIVNSFGVYQTYYESYLLSTNYTASQISWIGSIQAFFLVSIGVITGPVFDKGYLQPMLWLGSFLTVFGLMMISICKTYWQILLAQGVCVGIGSGCLFVPSMAVVAIYFTKKRALATGIAVGGGSIGGIILPITFRRLQPSIGFAWTTRVLAFIIFALLLVAVAVMRNPLPPKPGRALFQSSAFKSPPFILQSFGIMLGFIGLYVPIFYVQTYALTRDITSDSDYAFYLLSILNAGSFFGRILPNFLADKTGPMNMLVPCTVAAGILCLCWMRITSVAGITVFAALYGFFAGAYVSLLPPAIVQLIPDMRVVGTWMGMCLFIASFGLLAGNPIAGALVNIPEKQFAAAQGFAGGVILLGALLMCITLVLKRKQAKTWRI